MAPTFHFIERAYAPLVQRLGAPVTLSLRRCGFYPGGGGDLRVALSPIGPTGLQPFDVLTRGARQSAWAECLIPGLKRSIAERELTLLCQRLGWSPEQGHIGQARQNEGPGNALLAIVEHEHLTEVFSAIGDKGRSAETVADEVAQQVQRYLSSSAALGPYLADQWVLPLALAVWRSGRAAAYTCTGISLHAATNFQVIERFLPVHIHTAPLADGSGQRVSVQPR
jgi:RNA 3'-terminal phosphate cyclase (ATP)